MSVSSFCQFSHIPVVNKKAWQIISKRLQEAPLFYIKKMELLRESEIPMIISSCRYSPSTESMIKWSSAGKHGRLYLYTADMCTKCYDRDIRVNVREGSKICANCGLVCGQTSNDDTLSSTSYNQSYEVMNMNGRRPQTIPRKYSLSSYKRCNHFKEYLRRIQGIEQVSITHQEINLIREEVNKRGININEKIDRHLVRVILKSLKLQKYYNHIYHIIKVLTGKPLVTLTRSHCETLLRMFIKIQEPYGEYSNGRANMMSYYYVVKKLCEILGWHDISESLPFLKNSQKILEQDRIWKKICHSVGYPFIRSIL